MYKRQVNMRWSKTVILISLAASLTCLVISISCLLGFMLPLGLSLIHIYYVLTADSTPESEKTNIMIALVAIVFPTSIEGRCV